MKNALATSILAKLTSWYSFNGDATDSHGTNHITDSTSLSYVSGPHGQQLAAGSYGNHTLTTPIPISATTGKLTVGGWFEYDGSTGSANIPEFGLAWGATAGNEAFKVILNAASYFYIGIWGADEAGYNVNDPLTGAVNYPITVAVDDSHGQTGVSQQLIRIATENNMAAGRYFVVGTWDHGNRILYMDGVAVASEPPPSGDWDRTSIEWVGVGRSYSTNTATTTTCDECFFCRDAAMTADEIAWLFNAGAGRTYADVMAAA